MKMYAPKRLDVGFVILCAEDKNINLIRNTFRSINTHYPDSKCICVVDQSSPPEVVREIKTVCPTYKGKDSITALMNTGLRNGNKEWNCFIFAGAFVNGGEIKLMSTFVEDEKDIVFPIVDQKTLFYEATINGLLINKKTFKQTGPFETEYDLQLCRLAWMAQAQERGCRFKAVLGPRIM